MCIDRSPISSISPLAARTNRTTSLPPRRPQPLNSLSAADQANYHKPSYDISHWNDRTVSGNCHSLWTCGSSCTAAQGHENWISIGGCTASATTHVVCRGPGPVDDQAPSFAVDESPAVVQESITTSSADVTGTLTEEGRLHCVALTGNETPPRAKYS